jgi:hypothetical protein
MYRFFSQPEHIIPAHLVPPSMVEGTDTECGTHGAPAQVDGSSLSTLAARLQTGHGLTMLNQKSNLSGRARVRTAILSGPEPSLAGPTGHWFTVICANIPHIDVIVHDQNNVWLFVGRDCR